ncbi:MAG: aromatic amino acid DMT transporter YddG [Planctomycetes bacterium]|nr:aromatic amino acid DMT transporter YddG [Planctomycetota bacterium]
MSRSGAGASLAGLAACVLWASTFGVSRLLTEPLGSMTAGGLLFIVAGVMGCAWSYRTAEQRRDLRRLPLRYLLGCGAIFIAYEICIYGAIGLATTRQQVLEVSVINYAWPGLTLLLSIPLLGCRGRWAFPLGAAAAMGGVVTAMTPEGGWSLAGLVANVRGNGVAYALALGAAVTWAFYSNLIRRWAGHIRGGALPVFSLVGGGLMLALRDVFGDGPPQWSWSLLPPLAFMAVGPTMLSYILWDAAMRRGNPTLVASIAYITPVLSMITSALVLQIAPAPAVWIGCGLVVGGAAVCKISLR